MRSNPDKAGCVEAPRWGSDSTFTYRTFERAELTVRHLSLEAGQAMAFQPSTLDEAGVLILHLSAVDNFQLRGVTGLLWKGRCAPGSVNVVARREVLTLEASNSLQALILGIPHLSLPRAAPKALADRGERRIAAHDPCDAVGHGLGLAFLAAVKSAVEPHPLSAVHLARAMCCHFAFKHAWVQETFAGGGRHGLAPWQASTATSLLDRGDLQVREVAAACRLSSSAFSRLFRATFLRSPHDWKAERRIDAVKALLLEADVSLADAALQAGFSDQSSMSRSFRRLVGASPAAWRMNQREGEA